MKEIDRTLMTSENEDYFLKITKIQQLLEHENI